MNITAGSTAYDDQTRQRREGAELWGRTKSLLDERDSLEAEVAMLKVELARRQAADARKAAIMREARTAWIEAHIEEVIRNKKRALVDNPRHKWTGILMPHFERRGIKVLDEETRHDIEVPDIKTVRRVVKEFRGF